MIRRDFIKHLLAVSACFPVGSVTAKVGGQSDSFLDLQRADERFRLNIFSEPGLQVAAWLLRDQREGVWGIPDPRLLHVLLWVQRELGWRGESRTMVISSGLRTHRTNLETEGAALRSYHLPDQNGLFRAIDLVGSQARLKQYAEIFDTVPGLGIGIYPGHIHIDTRGRDARWTAR